MVKRLTSMPLLALFLARALAFALALTLTFTLVQVKPPASMPSLKPSARHTSGGERSHHGSPYKPAWTPRPSSSRRLRTAPLSMASPPAPARASPVRRQAPAKPAALRSPAETPPGPAGGDRSGGGGARLRGYAHAGTMRANGDYTRDGAWWGGKFTTAVLALGSIGNFWYIADTDEPGAAGVASRLYRAHCDEDLPPLDGWTKEELSQSLLPPPVSYASSHHCAAAASRVCPRAGGSLASAASGPHRRRDLSLTLSRHRIPSWWHPRASPCQPIVGYRRSLTPSAHRRRRLGEVSREAVPAPERTSASDSARGARGRAQPEPHLERIGARLPGFVSFERLHHTVCGGAAASTSEAAHSPSAQPSPPQTQLEAAARPAPRTRSSRPAQARRRHRATARATHSHWLHPAVAHATASDSKPPLSRLEAHETGQARPPTMMREACTRCK